MSPSQPPEPEPGAGPGDQPGGVIYKDGKPITVKRKPTEEEKRQKKRIERQRRKERRKEQKRIAQRAREQKERESELERYQDIKAEEREAKARAKPIVERPGEAGLPSDKRLDTQDFPDEPTFSERLHGVKAVSVKPPKPIEDIGRLGTEYEKALGFPSRFIRLKATGTLAKAEEAKLAGKDVQAGLYFSSYMAQRGLAGAWGGLTLPIRPRAIYKTVRTGVGLVVDPKVRKSVVETAKADPGGFTAELGGGLLGGTVLGRALRKAGLVRPSSYRLRKTTKAREITSPATLMPTGKYPSGTFDTKLWKKGGTPTLLLKDPSLMTVYEPVPVYKPSIVEPGMGLLSGLRPFSVSKEKPITTVKTIPVTSIPKGYLDVFQRTQTLPKLSIRGATETALILKPVEYTEKKPRPIVAPQIITAPKPTTRTRGKRIQEQIVAQTVRMDYVPVQRTRLKPLKMDLVLEEKRKKPMSLKGLTTVGEIRLRPIKPPRLKK